MSHNQKNNEDLQAYNKLVWFYILFTTLVFSSFIPSVFISETIFINHHYFQTDLSYNFQFNTRWIYFISIVFLISFSSIFIFIFSYFTRKSYLNIHEFQITTILDIIWIVLICYFVIGNIDESRAGYNVVQFNLFQNTLENIDHTILGENVFVTFQVIYFIIAISAVITTVILVSNFAIISTQYYKENNEILHKMGKLQIQNMSASVIFFSLGVFSISSWLKIPVDYIVDHQVLDYNYYVDSIIIFRSISYTIVIIFSFVLSSFLINQRIEKSQISTSEIVIFDKTTIALLIMPTVSGFLANVLGSAFI